MSEKEYVIFNFPDKPPHWLCEFVKYFGFTWSNSRRSWSAYRTEETQRIAKRAAELYEEFRDA